MSEPLFLNTEQDIPNLREVLEDTHMFSSTVGRKSASGRSQAESLNNMRMHLQWIAANASNFPKGVKLNDDSLAQVYEDVAVSLIHFWSTSFSDEEVPLHLKDDEKNDNEHVRKGKQETRAQLRDSKKTTMGRDDANDEAKKNAKHHSLKLTKLVMDYWHSFFVESLEGSDDLIRQGVCASAAEYYGVQRDSAESFVKMEAPYKGPSPVDILMKRLGQSASLRKEHYAAMAWWKEHSTNVQDDIRFTQDLAARKAVATLLDSTRSFSDTKSETLREKQRQIGTLVKVHVSEYTAEEEEQIQALADEIDKLDRDISTLKQHVKLFDHLDVAPGLETFLRMTRSVDLKILGIQDNEGILGAAKEWAELNGEPLVRRNLFSETGYNMSLFDDTHTTPLRFWDQVIQSTTKLSGQEDENDGDLTLLRETQAKIQEYIFKRGGASHGDSTAVTSRTISDDKAENQETEAMDVDP